MFNVVRHFIKIQILFVLLVIVIFPENSAKAQEPTPDPRFGLVQTYDDFEAAAESGTGYTRIKLYWDVIQPDGPDDWYPSNVPDPLVEADLAAGRQVVGLIVRTPAWARDLNNPANDPTNPQAKDVPDMEAWGQFVQKLVKQYEGKIDHWIIWNEPDVWDANHPGSTWNGTERDYFNLLKTAYLSIKAVDPDLKVYMAGLTYFWDYEYKKEQYLSRMLHIINYDPQAAANNYYFDGVIYHLYYKPQMTYNMLTDIKEILSSYALEDKEIWLNETNAPPSSDTFEPPHREPRFKATLEEQSAFIIQIHAMAFAVGVERIQVYKLFNSTEHPEDVQPFGLVRGDKSRRPAFKAYQLVTTYLAGFHTVNLSQKGDVTMVVFEREGKEGAEQITVLWNVAQTPRQVFISAIAPEAILVDETGQTQTLMAENGQYTLTLAPPACSGGECFIGGSPRFIVEKGGGHSMENTLETMTVQPTPTPIPPTQLEILMVSPRRRMALFGVSIIGAIVILIVLRQRIKMKVK